jgi:aspartate aminotransferase
MKLSKRAMQSEPSMTMALIALANEKKAQGQHVISMVAGEPDFPTPDNICMAGIKAIATGDTKYGSATGSLTLRRAIARKFLEDNALTYAPDEIVVATGTKPLLYTAFMALCDEGDEVIVPAPYWVSYPSLVTLAGAAPAILPCREEAGFKLTPETLRTAITPNTRVLLLNSPGNPTGAVYSREELQDILAVLRDHPRIFIVTDDIYEHLVYDGKQHHCAAELAPDLKERIIVINGFSKGYGMIGWRLGFAAGPKQVMTAMGSFLSHILGAPSTITQAAALAALVDPKPYIASNRDDYARRRDVAMQLLARIPGLQCASPGGAFFLFVNCSGLFGKTTSKGACIDDDAAFAKAAIDEAGVAIVPGSSFGMPGYFRLSYSMSQDDICLGLEALTRFCASLS